MINKNPNIWTVADNVKINEKSPDDNSKNAPITNIHNPPLIYKLG